MITIGQTIILNDGEAPSVEAFNKAQNIIAIAKDEETQQETIHILKLKDKHKFEEANSHFTTDLWATLIKKLQKQL